MILQIFLSVLVVLFTYFYYNKVYLVKKKINHYKQLFEQAGYRVLVEGYKLIGSKAIDHLLDSAKNFNNPMHYHQHELAKYDVAIGSCNMQPYIQLIHVDLIQAYFNMNSYNFQKFKPLKENISRVVGKGMAFSEGVEWKKKRKIVSNVFHFEFLHSLIPKMLTTIDEFFNEFDAKNPDH